MADGYYEQRIAEVTLRRWKNEPELHERYAGVTDFHEAMQRVIDLRIFRPWRPSPPRATVLEFSVRRRFESRRQKPQPILPFPILPPDEAPVPDEFADRARPATGRCRE